ncbi:Suppressor of tumorigenicity 14 protein, partial [Coemansia erecta]
MNILVLALSAASVFALPPTLKVPANERIIGGEAAAPNAFPSAVSLQILLPQGPGLCGGTLINNHAIVTAAHCLYNYGSQAPVPASSVRIGYGSNSQSRETTVQARQVHLHPDFNPAETNNDIAVILIDQLTALNDSVRPATIFNGPLPEGTALTAVGWGLTSATGTSGDLPDLLQQTGIVVGQRDACRQLVPDYESSDGPQICTQNSLKPGADTCQGDSGTGVFVTSNGKSFLAGLTSFGSAPDGDPTCALDNGLAIYTHVFYFRAFLD